MRRWFVLSIILLSLCLPIRVQAQSVPAIKHPVETRPGAVFVQGSLAIQSLEVDVWPEYDRPTVLIIYRITLGSQVKLPTEMTLRVPISSGGPSAIAEQTANGLFNLEFNETGRDSQWITVRFTTTLPQLQIEYYDSTLQKNGAQRSFTYLWPGDYAVDNLLVKFQQPPTATQMTLAPNTGTASVGQDGLTYFDVPLGQVDVGETFQIQTQYQKSNDDLTQGAAFEQVTPVSPSNAVAVSPAFPQVLPWLLGGLGVILIGGGVFWYLRGSRITPAPSRPRHSPAETAASGEAFFCHQCGKKATAADVFCRTCGTKLRR
jgi:hypothetical protein